MKTINDIHLPIWYTFADGHKERMIVTYAMAKVICDECEERLELQAERNHTKDGYVESISEADAFFSLPKTEETALYRVAIKKTDHLLTDIQRRRFVAYYAYGYTYQEIAKAEKVTYSAIRHSIKQAVKILKENL